MTPVVPDIDQIVSTLKRLVADEIAPGLSLDQLDEHRSLKDDLRLDSVALMELIAAVEQRFAFEFEDSDLRMSGFANLRTLAELIRTRLSARSQ